MVDPSFSSAHLSAQPLAGGTMIGPVLVDSPALVVARAYEVMLGRQGDVSGLQYWQTALAGGTSLDEVLKGFSGSAEFTSMYGALSDDQYVTTMFANAFERTPSQADLDLWVGQLQAGAVTRADLATAFYYSPESATHLMQLAGNAGTLAPAQAGLQLGAAKLTVNADNPDIETSTYKPGSFAITNTGLQPIARLEIDISTAAFPDLVFDPSDGTPAGNQLGKGFQFNGGPETGVVIPADVNVDPFTGAYKNGFTQIALDFKPGQFQTGETLQFSTDIDPASIQGELVNGSAGHVSGLELTGATVRVVYADGRVQTGQISGDGSAAGGEAHLNAVLGPTPTLTVGGLGSGTKGVLDGTDQIVTISGGLPGTTMRVQVVEGELGGIGPDPSLTPTDPVFDANKAIASSFFDTVLDSTGAGSVDISGALTADTDARFYVSAANVVELDPASPGLETTGPVADEVIFKIQSEPFIA